MYMSQHCDKHTIPWRHLWRLRLGTSGRLAEVAAAAIAVVTAGTREGGRGGGGVRWRLGAATEKQRMRKAAEGGGRRRRTAAAACVGGGVRFGLVGGRSASPSPPRTTSPSAADWPCRRAQPDRRGSRSRHSHGHRSRCRQASYYAPWDGVWTSTPPHLSSRVEVRASGMGDVVHI